MKEQPLVSVIIPVYNVERYLAQCLDSVSRQIYQNLEIICVNDGSRDGSPDILRRYADEDARIQVIDKANGGVSQARNDALDCARGEYIMFVDSDDWVEPDACENAVNAMREYDADIVMWSYVSETENRSSRKVIFPETTVFEKEEVRAKLHRRFVGAMGEELSHPELVDSLCPVWGKLYRRSLIQKSGARFVDLAEIGSYEDGLFNLEVFGKADRVVYLAAYLYHYRRDGSSSVTSGYNPRLYDQWQTLYDRMEAIIRSNQLGSEYEAALNNRIALGILGLGLNITVSTQSMGKKAEGYPQDHPSGKVSEGVQKPALKLFPNPLETVLRLRQTWICLWCVRAAHRDPEDYFKVKEQENDNSFFGFGRDSGLRPDLGAANPVSQAEFHILRRTLRLQVAADALADRVRLHRLSGRHALRNERYLRLYSVV